MKCPLCQGEFSLKEAKIRSTPENKYYWGVIVKILSDELGYHQNEMHEILKAMFLTEIKHVRTNKDVLPIKISKSSASLTIGEFEDYLSNIRQWASSELNIFIPEPNEEIPECT